MARIRDFEHVSAFSRPHPTSADAEWTTIGTGEDRLFQISTFGSDERASHKKVSQTIQLDRQAAALLKRALEESFPGI